MGSIISNLEPKHTNRCWRLWNFWG